MARPATLYEEHDKDNAELLPAIIAIPEDPCLYSEDATRAYIWARDAWWKGRHSIQEISEIIDVPYWKVRKWVAGTATEYGWAEQKEEVLKNTLRKTVEKEKDRVEYLIKKMVGILGRSVDRLDENKDALSVSEFSSFANSLEKIFKVHQLMLGNPTDIFGVNDASSMTWADVVTKIKENDILDYKETDKVSEKVALRSVEGGR